jgi:hypothetical protein
MKEELSCLNCGSVGDDVEMRWPGYGTRYYPRCESCGDKRVAREEENKRRYFGPKPGDFDYLDAGEHWDESEL